MTSRQRFIGGVWRTATGRKRYIGGAWRTATRRKIYKGGAWHDAESYAPAFSASASPSAVSGTVSNPSPSIVSSDYVTVTPIGGLAPYTYSWDGGGATPTAPANATTSFYKTGVVPGGSFETSAGCTIADSLGATTTVSVPVSLFNEG